MDEIAKLILAQNKLLAEIAGTLSEIAGENLAYSEYTTDESGRVFRTAKVTRGSKVVTVESKELLYPLLRYELSAGRVAESRRV